jgi:hypothetical protein
MAAATSMTATATMATTESSTAEAMPTTTKASFMPAAKAARVAKAAVTAERIVMSVAVMVLPIIVVSEFWLVVSSTKISIPIGRVAIARIAIVVISRFAASTYCKGE